MLVVLVVFVVFGVVLIVYVVYCLVVRHHYLQRSSNLTHGLTKGRVDNVGVGGGHNRGELF